MNVIHDGACVHDTPNAVHSIKNKNVVDATGLVFGKLTVIRQCFEKRKSRWAYWLCQCQCGNTTTVKGAVLRAGLTKSCGCANIDRIRDPLRHPRRTHGMRHTWQYHVYCSIVQRCTNKNNRAYPEYGGRGISFDPRWKEDFTNFVNDLAAMGERPPGHSIDRIDFNGNYVLSNMRWATQETQNRNTRKNIFITFNGERRCIAEWAEKTGLPKNTLWVRINKGWPIERALTEPLRKTSPYTHWNSAKPSPAASTDTNITP